MTVPGNTERQSGNPRAAAKDHHVSRTAGGQDRKDGKAGEVAWGEGDHAIDEEAAGIADAQEEIQAAGLGSDAPKEGEAYEQEGGLKDELIERESDALTRQNPADTLSLGDIAKSSSAASAPKGSSVASSGAKNESASNAATLRGNHINADGVSEIDIAGAPSSST
ncbi:uncharacterized protein L969DRAFT_16037 [Mixia osmundae IAM 14324]|uniref:Uncharacterized protein n=1 Tax=Mixia osmundae (strain CBS 9802 / IAM 14324 / JCM 22182 / KY 12970) TaxID=764103 RepID=G7E5R7_MIXOS|nr:uncharacterized protein L969DRAFT_16037 [Mixia osmundae IAM 14324]KEI40673.1 hypothetical protein L969DRAFT_16037 [Mixia osmundae IAM 14324]GAA98177.1 hypothetical protein E5Q_04860 [Mixia osmundae IAM 14324]